MKKTLIAISLLFIITLTACSGASYSDTAKPSDIADKILTETGISKTTLETPDTAATDIILQGVAKEKIDSTCILKSAESTNVNEIGVIKAATEKDTADIKKALDTYLADRLVGGELYKDYLPEEFPKFENGKAEVKGKYVVYTILDSKATPKAVEAFTASIKK
ncbi:MAG: DUF4358 domain-containing protein [Clostridia bacterium]